VLVALLIGSIEALGLLGDKLRLEGSFWIAVGDLNQSMGAFGFVVIGVLLICWVVSALIYRWNRYDELVPETLEGPPRAGLSRALIR
jgi:high-affinity nickel-transport protein